MNHDTFYVAYPWVLYTKKMIEKIENPRFVGFFQSEHNRNFRVVRGQEKSPCEQAFVVFYWLVDELDGVIADVKYQFYGPSVLIAILEAACEMLLRKNHDQARRITADMLEHSLKDTFDDGVIFENFYSYFNLVISAIENVADQCTDIPFEEFFANSSAYSGNRSEYPGWSLLDKEKKLKVIEEVMEKEIRPYIELDAGGIEVIDLSEEDVLTITYSGACHSCHSATGSTLSSIEYILQAQIYPTLRVTVDFSFKTDEE